VTLATLQQLVATPPVLPGPSESAAQRQAVIAELAAAGLPTSRRESWRYTELKPLAETAFDIAASPPSASAVRAAALAITADALAATAQRLVLVDGHPVAELGTWAPGSGVELGNLESRWPRFAALHRKRVTASEHPLAALNFGYSQAGVWLHVPEGVKVAVPLHLVFIGSGTPGLALHPRIAIELGSGAELTVVQQFLDSGDAAGWINVVTQVEQAADSRLTLYRIQRHGQSQAHTSLLAVDLAAGAHASIGYVDLGGRLVRNDVDVRLGDRGASVELFGAFLAGGGQHVDNHTRIDHAAPATRSDESFRGIIGRRGRGVFNGKVVVHAGAQQTDARQSSDNLLLSEQAEIDAKPELEIYADDVKCSHGAAVGDLDEAALFYLRARGIPNEEARRMLIEAFVREAVELVDSPPLREHLLSRLARRLASLEE